MKNPDQWAGELLPLVRGDDEYGVLYCPLGAGSPEPVIYLANLFDVAGGKPLGAFPRQRYASLDAITADGWEVD
jgi:hypothetical protein